MSIVNYMYSTTWFKPLRFLLAGVYYLIIALRNFLYDLGIFKIHSVETPVISVGNLSAGGSGKTILVQALVEYFQTQNIQPAVLSRGYGRSTKGLRLVADKLGLKEDPLTAGDEPFLIAHNYPGVPVVVSENRVVGAQYLERSFRPGVIILDDGFQHRRLDRNLDILLVDWPVNQAVHLLPWGALREPFANKQRADLVLYSKAGLRGNSHADLTFNLTDSVYDHAGNSLLLSELQGEYGLFAGLGNPDYFFESLQAQHYPATTKIAFPDHARYEASQLAKISNRASQYWITTQKDYIKLRPEFCRQQNIYYIKLKTKLPPALLDQLKQNFN